VRAWLPTDEDKAHVQSLMGRVVEPGKFANWIAPARWASTSSGDFEYVRSTSAAPDTAPLPPRESRGGGRMGAPVAVTIPRPLPRPSPACMRGRNVPPVAPIRQRHVMNDVAPPISHSSTYRPEDLHPLQHVRGDVPDRFGVTTTSATTW